jgi:hypothetical protein
LCDYKGDVQKTFEEKCLENYNIYTKLLWGQVAVDVDAWIGKQFCLKEVVIGQGSAFGVKRIFHDQVNRPVTPDIQKGRVARKARDAIFSHMHNYDLKPPNRLKVLVIPKSVRPGIPNLCKNITALVNEFSSVDVFCLDVSLSIEDEIAYISEFPFVVVEAGTTAYLSVFTHDGTVVLAIGQKELVKEMDILPYFTHVKVFFSVYESAQEMTSMLRYCLHLSASAFQFSFKDYLIAPLTV